MVKWRMLTGYAKAIGFGVLISLSVDLIGHFLKQPQHPNYFVFNIFLLFDLWIFGIAAASLLKRRKRMYNVLFLLFGMGTIYCVYNFLFLQKEQFNTYSFLVESLILVFLYLVAFIDQYTISIGPIYRQPFFWICIGNIVFYASNIPFFAFFHYLVEYHQEAARSLYLITKISSLVRSMLFLIAFLFFTKPAKSLIRHERQ